MAQVDYDRTGRYDLVPTIITCAGGRQNADQLRSQVRQALTRAGIDCTVLEGTSFLSAMSRRQQATARAMCAEHPPIQFSIVVPIYNEEANIPELHRRLTETMDGLGDPYELVFVDDGSRDRTLEIAGDLARADDRLRVVEFRKNYGQTPAMAAGIDLARGDIIITMDGDLQNDPRDIRSFIEKMAEGFDIVVGWRHNRQDKLITRKIPSRIANWLIGKVTGVPIKDSSSGPILLPASRGPKFQVEGTTYW